MCIAVDSHRIFRVGHTFFVKILGPVHHVGLTVPDLDAALRWYDENLGFRLVAQTRNEDLNLDMALVAHPGGGCLELFGLPQTTRTEPEYSDVPSHLPFEGWRHVAFDVPDIAQALAQASEQGIEIASGINLAEPFGYKWAFIRDPFGNLLEFVEALS